ncbi:MAG TPA: TssN family type VI secretion system protein [Chitinophaga sp.]
MDVKPIFTSYILFPLLAMIMGAVMVVLNQKNKLMSSRRLVVTVLLTSLVLAIPGFGGALGLQFMPWGYLANQLIYLLLGILAVYLLSRHYPEALEHRKGLVALGGLMAVALGVCLFRLAFNWLSDLDYGWLAATSMLLFLAPLAFWWAYMAMIDIPAEIYTVWYYPRQVIPMDLFDVDLDKLKVLEVELFKAVNDPSPLKVKVKAPPDMVFGTWFQQFIDDYNTKFPRSGVQFEGPEGDAYGWIFYLKPSFFKKKQFIDPDRSVAQNQIREQYTIHARRVTRLEHALGGEDRVVVL